MKKYENMKNMNKCVAAPSGGAGSGAVSEADVRRMFAKLRPLASSAAGASACRGEYREYRDREPRGCAG